MKSPAQIKAAFGGSEQRARMLLRVNATNLHGIAAKAAAHPTGCYRGKPAAFWLEKAATFEKATA